jgi:hypothetical protein
MARKIQLGALILGMLLVGVERFTAQASTQATGKVQAAGFPVNEGGPPVPPPQ